MFLSANNFFYRVDYRGDRMTRVAMADLGRRRLRPSEPSIANDRGRRRAGFIVRATPASAWLFAGHRPEPGARSGSFGIEIDKTARSSPPVPRSSPRFRTLRSGPIRPDDLPPASVRAPACSGRRVHARRIGPDVLSLGYSTTLATPPAEPPPPENEPLVELA